MQLYDSACRFSRSPFNLTFPFKLEQSGLSLGAWNLRQRLPFTVGYSRPAVEHSSPFVSITFEVRGDNLLIFHQHSRLQVILTYINL
jgi:hypothetical protein